MTREEVSDKIKKIIFDSVPDRVPEVITDDTVILVICRCEAELGVKIPERKWQKLSTFGEVVDEFMRQLAKTNK